MNNFNVKRYDSESGLYSYKKDGQWHFSFCPPDKIIMKKADGKWHFIDNCTKEDSEPEPEA